MRPILFYWRGRAVWSYPALLYVGSVVGIVAGNLIANARGLNGTRVYFASVLLLPIALLGGRLTFVLGRWDLFRRQPALIWRRELGGLVMYGGLLSVPVSAPLLRALDVPFWAFWDIGAAIMLIGMVFTRFGCLLNGCCVGRETASRFGLVLRDRAGVVKRRIPTQMLEAALGTAVLAAMPMIPGDAPPGTFFLSALAAYAFGRVLLEGTREEHSSALSLGALGAVSIALVALAVVLLLFVPRAH
jgi:phosphatidylglycerol---prolipoprotein diacylglyceryl transferase